MAGIEDFVVEQIINDFQQQAAPQNIQGMQQAANTFPAQASNAMDTLGFGYPPIQPQSAFTQEAQYAGNMRQRGGLPEGAVDDPRSPLGFSISDPALLEKYRNYSAKLAGSAAGGEMMDRAYRERDAQRFKIMEGLKGLDPAIQGTILKRLGINPGVLKSQLEQQKELAKYKTQLEGPQNEIENAMKMLIATQGGQRNVAELGMKQRQFEAEQGARQHTQNIDLMRVLAVLMKSDASGRLEQTLGPILMEMLQGAGINLTPQKPQIVSSGRGSRSGIKITRE